MAVLRVDGGAEIGYAELMGWCEARMPAFMIPRYVRVIRGDFPRTPTNRIQKYLLREAGVTEDTWDRVRAGYRIRR